MSTELGAWSDYKLVSNAVEVEKIAIEGATPTTLGATWIPQLISSQVVNGLNFKIIYTVSTVTPHSFQSLVEISGYRALDGTITIKGTSEVHALGTHYNLVGGWTLYHELSDTDKAIFDEAKILGVNRKPFLVSTQVVNGVNYHFISLSRITAPKTPQTIEKLKIYKPFDGKASITTINTVVADLSKK